jgi:hypothetical protein
MWASLETSSLAQWIHASTWPYPTLLSIHGLGMGVVVGLTAVVALRVLGFPKDIPLGAYMQTLPYLVVAFVLNAASGIALFVADASSLASNVSFQIKLAAIAVGLVVVWRLYAGTVAPAARAEADPRSALLPRFPPARSARVLAVLSLLIWSVSVIVSGRLIAYLNPAL